MLNEIEEFRAYTEPPIYKAVSKRDTTYMGRFTLDLILNFNGLARVLTILTRDTCLQIPKKIPETELTIPAGHSVHGAASRTKRKPALDSVVNKQGAK